MHKTFAISKHCPDIKNFRAHWLHDHLTDTYFTVHWPRGLQEQLAFEQLPGLIHLPHIEDQMTRLSHEHVQHMPTETGITTEHNTYQALLRLYAHYKWVNFHPHQ